MNWNTIAWADIEVHRNDTEVWPRLKLFKNRDAAYVRENRFDHDGVIDVPLRQDGNHYVPKDHGVVVVAVKMRANGDVKSIDLGVQQFTNLRVPRLGLPTVDRTCIASTFYNGCGFWADDEHEPAVVTTVVPTPLEDETPNTQPEEMLPSETTDAQVEALRALARAMGYGITPIKRRTSARIIELLTKH